MPKTVTFAANVSADAYGDRVGTKSDNGTTNSKRGNGKGHRSATPNRPKKARTYTQLDGRDSDPMMEKSPLFHNMKDGEEEEYEENHVETAVESDSIMNCLEEENEEEQGNTKAEEQEGEDETNSDDEEWLVAVASIRREEDSAVFRQNLETFVQAMERRKLAQERLARAFEECEKDLENVAAGMLKDTIAPLHSELQKTTEELESDTVTQMKNNYSTRTKLVDTLEQIQTQWDSACGNLAANVLKETPPPQEQVQATQVDVSHAQDHQEEELAEDALAGEDPDWEALAQYEPSRKNIEAFLEARDRATVAEDRFTSDLDDVHEGFKMFKEQILQTVIDAFTKINEKLDEEEAEIQWRIMDNFERRQQFMKDIHEHSTRAQGIFSSLLARVASVANVRPTKP